MKRSDGIENTGGSAPQTPCEENSIVIAGDLTTGMNPIGSASQQEERADENATPGEQDSGSNRPGDGHLTVEDPRKAGPEAKAPPRKPHLSEEQQLWLNRVFIPNFRRELMRNLKAEHLLSERERGDRKDLKAKAEDLEKQELERLGEYEKLLAKKDEALGEIKKGAEEEKVRLLGIISEIKIDKELIASASRLNAVSPSQAAQLLRSAVRLDDQLRPVVLDEEGERAVNVDGKFMTIDEKVSCFLDENPHMVRPSGLVSGSGAGDSVAGRVTVAAITGGDLISEGLREEKRKHGDRNS